MNEKRHLLYPRDDKMLTNKCYVCDVHFASRFILKTFSHVINGEKVEIPRDRWALTSVAYPSNFPNCPKYSTLVSLYLKNDQRDVSQEMKNHLGRDHEKTIPKICMIHTPK
ncbi:uncharacterized protein LOC111640409 [Centruroides sculpturatus]|uniref:uncharacterized protein LOC111640409 n=1 Tax=Centruroides sculpturatus TaxID=218467 RepID=UPI000C6E5A86|nr:uncharacterized protein LOC111640409 [Centruroides sculpturatus]